LPSLHTCPAVTTLLGIWRAPTSVVRVRAQKTGKKENAALTRTGLPLDYAAFLESLKTRVRQAQTKAMLSVNRELIQLYWDIGRRIVERQEQEGWGKSVVDRLAADLQKAFPGIRGFSASNVSRMRAFFLAYSREAEISAQPVPKMKTKKPARAVPKSSDPAPKRISPCPVSRHSLGPQCRPVVQGFRFGRAPLVRRQDAGARLEPARAHGADRERPLSASGQGRQQFRRDAAGAAI
jgi:hypothetical protein